MTEEILAAKVRLAEAMVSVRTYMAENWTDNTNPENEELAKRLQERELAYEGLAVLQALMAGEGEP